MSDRDLFLLIIDKVDAESRLRLLDELCSSDPTRRARIERLLRAHEKAGEFLEQSLEEVAPTLVHAPTSSRACHVGVGSVLAGRYTLLRPIGRGGMGVVWIAEQSEPVARQVAVKLIRPDLDSATTFARFASERQTLAMMDHPNIAKVFDGGTTEDGRPFVVMELVEGVPITRHCDEEQFDLEQRLELFITVCRAIHHAHQKGIIHRDLKPSNVLIANRDGQPVPKIIDFGVAKTTHARLDALGTFTGQGDVIGTPQYWSPEQAGLNPHDIDTRSDIYGLGLLLYELLTGRQPFAVETSGAMGIVELVRAIREADPPPPSGITLHQTNAQARQSTPEKLMRRLRGELDWIVMKCLEKDRNRRYESADGLAADLRRYLVDEPVAASPPSTTYRLRKFARKHRRPLTAAAALVAVLLCGIVGTTVGMVRAARAEAEAREHELTARQRFILAQLAVDSYLTAITDDPELKRADHHQLRLKLLASAIPFYQKLAAEKPNDRDQMLAQAIAFERHANLSREIGDSDTAWTNLQKAEQILERLNELPASGNAALLLAIVKRRLADLAVDRSDSVAARRDYHAAIGILERLIIADPTYRTAQLELARTCNNFGLLLGQENDSLAAIQFERAVRMLDDFREYFGASSEALELQSVCLNNWGNLLTEGQRYRDARGHLERAIELTKQLAAEDPDSPTLIQKRAGLLANLSRVREAEGDRVAARQGMESASEALKVLAERFPHNSEYRIQWAGVENNVAMLQTELGDPRGALARHDKVIAHLTSVSSKQHGLYSDYFSNAHAGRAVALQKLDRQEEASSAWKVAVEHAPKELKPLRESTFAVHLARIGRSTQAREIVARLEHHESKLVLYNLACVCAILHRQQPNAADADHAIVLLRAAIERGYTQKQLIEHDPDLDGLRDRTDYRNLIGRNPPDAGVATQTIGVKS